MEVKVPKNYQKILDFWANKGAKPTPEEASQGLMELVNNLKLENCIYHKDVIDAMFRQTKSDATLPYKKHLVINKKIINSVDYDLGRNGFAYLDRDTGNYYLSSGGDRNVGNRGNIYRNDGVDITLEAGKTDSYYISHFETDEWLQYTIEAKANGVFNIVFTVASENGEGKLELAVNGVAKAPLAIPNSKGWEKWQIVTLKNISLKKGVNVLRIKAQKGDFNFKSFQFITQK